LPFLKLAYGRSLSKTALPAEHYQIFFKLLKGAMKIEEVRLETKERVEKFITFLAILCFPLFWISRINPQDQTLAARLFFPDKDIRLVKKVTKSTKETSEFLRRCY
jgi:hypothetical protein